MIILASKSPRRSELLSKLGLEYRVLAKETAERFDRSLPLTEAIQKVSAAKAEAVLPFVAPEDVIVSADTIVVLDGRVLGKPHSEDEAKQMLQSLSGRTHLVMTGVTALRGDRRLAHTEVTEVTFRPLSAREIETYVATGDPMDKAGAYGVQNGAACFVRALRGDFFNVMGLPLCALAQLLRRLGVTVLGEGGSAQ